MVPPWESHPLAQDHGSFRSVLIHRNSAALIICPKGVKLDLDALPLPRQNTWLEHLMTIAALLVIFGWGILCLQSISNAIDTILNMPSTYSTLKR